MKNVAMKSLKKSHNVIPHKILTKNASRSFLKKS